MTVPTYQEFMLPLLKLASDGEEHHIRNARQALADDFGLTEEDRQETLPSGQIVLTDRVSWARTYLKKAELLKDPRRGYFKITDRGRKFLKRDPQEITVPMLRQYPEFEEFWIGRRPPQEGAHQEIETAQPEYLGVRDTPDEQLEKAWTNIRRDLESEILDRVLESDPEFFEKLVVDLLVRMGYGGGRAAAGEAIGRTGDEGIDGVIREDPLGLDVIYLQAKRWKGSVGRPEIQQFAGALQGKRARKGVFITTGEFSNGAKDYAKNIESRLVLIGGKELARLMVDHDVGVSVERSFEMKRIDTDYFEPE